MKKNFWKSALATALAASALFTLTACGGDETTTSQTPDNSASVSQSGGENSAQPTGIQTGTTFTFWSNTDFPNHLPWMDNYASQLQLQVYDNLLYKYHQDSDDIRGNIAESWTVSEDGLVWTFTLKDDVYFTSGNQVTAEAFVKSWDAAKPYQPRYFEVVESYEATGELELTVTLNTPSPTFIYELPMRNAVGVVDPELLEEYGPEDNRAAVGCGPYYIESYTAGENITLKANPNYHNPDRAPTVETCVLQIIPDINTAMLALMGGQIDGMNTTDMEVVNTLEGSGWEPISWVSRTYPWWFNAERVEIFKDEAVREALCHMIDWSAINSLVYDGRYNVVDSYWGGAGSYPYDEGYEYNPELGVQMIEEAGYSKDDIDFTFVVNPNFADEVTAIIAQFNELGFNNIDMENYDATTCLGMIKSGEYDITVTHNGYDNENPAGTYGMGLLPDGTQRIMWLEYMDEAAYEEALAHYETALKSPDFETYEAEISEITRICQENFCSLGALQAVGFSAVSPEFEGVYNMELQGYMEFCYLYPVG